MENNSTKSLLVIMAKEPRPGQVKTRLSPEFSPQEAAELYLCLLQDRLLEMADANGVDVAVAYSPQSATDAFAVFVPKHIDIFPQRDGELGARLHAIFVGKKAQGYEAIAVIDSDSPDLPKSLVLESFRLLLQNRTDVVFGPCADGGYYLIGMKKIHPELFTGIPWSTENVLDISLEKANKSGIRTALLAAWNDIDTFQDVIAFYNQYDKNPGRGNRPGKITYSYLCGLKKFLALVD